MFTKLFLAICIVVFAAIVGIRKAKYYEEREQVIRDSILLFNRVENDIKYNLTILPNAIESARQGLNSKLKDVLGSIVISLLEYNHSDSTIVQEINSLDCLKPYDKQIISQGIISLGNADKETQINLINGTIATLNEIVSEAKEEKIKNAKLYRTVGIVTGLMLAIVIV